jgi:hypothetical protein
MAEVSPTSAVGKPRTRTTWGFVLACLASGYALPLIFFLAAGVPPKLVLPGLGAFLLAGLLLSCAIVLVAGIPAVHFIDIAEARGLRSPVLYGAAGALIAMVPMAVLVLLAGGGRSNPHGLGWLLMPTLISGVDGLIGGLVYWLVAGRSAGTSRAPEAPSASS